MAQKFEQLTLADEERLKQQRGVIEHFWGDANSNREKYTTAAGKLGLLRAVLDAKVFRPDQTYELQCMGIVLGDVFVQQCGWLWRMSMDAILASRSPAVPQCSFPSQ